MNSTEISKEELLQELLKLKAENDFLKSKYESVSLKGNKVFPNNYEENQLLSESESLKIIHELEVHQIELEMINNELIISKEKSEIAEEKFSRLYDLSPSGYFTISNEGNIIELNLYGTQLLGKEKSILKNKKFGSFIAKESKEDFDQFISAIFKSGFKETCCVYLLTNEDNLIYAFLSGILTDNGKQCLLTVTDLTERKLIEKELIASKESYKTLFENSGTGIVIVDSNGFYLMVNKIASKQYGLEPEEIIGKSMFDLLTLESASKYLELNRILIDTGGKREYEDTFIMQGVQKTYLIVDQCLKDSNGVNYAVQSSSIDITMRKNAEEALKNELDLFSEGPVITIVWRYEEGWPIKYVSGNVSQILGYSRSEILSDDFFFSSIIHPDDTERIYREVNQNIDNHSNHFEQSYRIKTKSGKYLWIYDFTNIEWGIDGQIKSLRGYVFDQTLLKETEAKLADESRRLYDIIRGTDSGTWEWNIQTGETNFNEKWAEILGYSLEEISPVSIETWNKFVHPEDIIKSNELLEKHFKGEIDYYSIEIRMKHRNGDWIWVLDRGRVHKWNEEGKPLLMSGSHQDINLRKTAEDKIHEAWLYNRSLIEASIDSLVTINAEGIITDVNKATEKITGVSRDKLIGSNFANYFTEPNKAIEGYMMVFTEDVVKDYPLTILHSSGKTTDVLYNASIYKNDSGQVQGVFAVARDITDIKKAEALIQIKNLELIKLNASKDKFFSIIAHDLRAPFSGFLGLTKMMSENINDFNSQELQRISNKMQISASNLYQLLENLLEWARMQRDISSFNPQKYTLNSFVKRNIEIVNELAKQKEIKINNYTPEDLKIVADLPMLNTILRNLIANAIKFTNRGGIIEIGISEDSQVNNKDYVQVYVKDNGIGMNINTIEKLFQLDQKVSRAGTEKEPSTGLGLLLCKDFIEKMNGKIWVESSEGVGTTFYFTIPK